MFDALLEAARIIEDRPAPVHHVPEVVEQAQPPPVWESRRLAPPLPALEDPADDRLVPRTESPDLSRPYTRCPETHNEVEKRRRAYLTQCYVELQAVVPSIADCKASNVTVLRNAAEYIQKLIEDGHRIEEAKNYELRRRAMLLSRISVARSRAHGGTPYAAYYAPATYAPPGAAAMAQSRYHEEALRIGRAASVSPARSPMPVPMSVTNNTGDETETEDEEEGVVPDPMSRGASPRAAPVEGLTELSDRMALSARKKIRTRVLGDLGNGHAQNFAGKFQRPHQLSHRRIGRSPTRHVY
mmetsp:Transcript_5257/g.7462  ORF Transcript_5257/g.7462 Transcript_5257/m.7462 type:complete len:299 (-) Transcript_5257:184-1080(-)